MQAYKEISSGNVFHIHVWLMKRMVHWSNVAHGSFKFCSMFAPCHRNSQLCTIVPHIMVGKMTPLTPIIHSTRKQKTTWVVRELITSFAALHFKFSTSAVVLASLNWLLVLSSSASSNSALCVSLFTYENQSGQATVWGKTNMFS